MGEVADVQLSAQERRVGGLLILKVGASDSGGKLVIAQ